MAGAPPFPYSDELGLEICEEIATRKDGLETLRNENLHWPRPRTVYKWILTNESFAQKYAHAKSLQQEVLVNYMLERCENSGNDTYTDDNGKVCSNMASIQRDRLIADNIKRTTCRLLRKYNDKSQVDTNVTINHESSIKDLA